MFEQSAGYTLKSGLHVEVEFSTFDRLTIATVLWKDKKGRPHISAAFATRNPADRPDPAEGRRLALRRALAIQGHWPMRGMTKAEARDLYRQFRSEQHAQETVQELAGGC